MFCLYLVHTYILVPVVLFGPWRLLKWDMYMQELCLISLNELLVVPASLFDTQLNSSGTPVFAVVVHLSRHQAGPLKSLLFGQQGQETEDDGDVLVELQPHESVRYGVGDVLKVHGAALDQDTNGDDGVKGSGRGTRLGGGFSGSFQVGGAGREKVGC